LEEYFFNQRIDDCSVLMIDDCRLKESFFNQQSTIDNRQSKGNQQSTIDNPIAILLFSHS